jgi:cyclophilin family peptidyl-prolyl cis-trans isomerase
VLGGALRADLGVNERAVHYGPFRSLESRTSTQVSPESGKYGAFDDSDGFAVQHGVGTVSMAKPPRNGELDLQTVAGRPCGEGGDCKHGWSGSAETGSMAFGLVPMVADRLNDNGGEFLISLGGQESAALDGLLVVFGRVVEGLGVAQQLAQANLHLTDDGAVPAIDDQWSYVKKSGELDEDGNDMWEEQEL